MSKRAIAYAACGAVAVGTFLPFRHVMFRDVNALYGGPGIVFLVIAGVAAALVWKDRYRGAAFCGAAILVLLGLQYAATSRADVVSSTMWDINTAFGNQPSVLPAGLHTHPDAGFYLIAIGALALVLAPLYGGRHAPGQNVGGRAGSGSEANGRATVGQGEFDGTDRTE